MRTQSLGTPSHEDTRREEVNSRWIQITGGLLDPHMGLCIGASRENARELDLVRSEVAREQGHGSRHLGHQESTRKLFNPASSKVVRERGRDSMKVLR